MTSYWKHTPPPERTVKAESQEPNRALHYDIRLEADPIVQRQSPKPSTAPCTMTSRWKHTPSPVRTAKAEFRALHYDVPLEADPTARANHKGKAPSPAPRPAP